MSAWRGTTKAAEDDTRDAILAPGASADTGEPRTGGLGNPVEVSPAGPSQAQPSSVREVSTPGEEEPLGEEEPSTRREISVEEWESRFGVGTYPKPPDAEVNAGARRDGVPGAWLVFVGGQTSP